jgi:TonB C terminal
MADALPPYHPCRSEDLFSRLRQEHRRLTSCAAALTALGLHVLVVAPALWAGGASYQRQERRYGSDTAMQWVVLEDSAGSSAVIRPPSPPKLMPIGMADALTTLPLSTLPAEASDAANSPADGQSGYGALEGRYLGQIRARIDRAWQRPRSAIGAPIFQCQVQVDQDRFGRVQQVTLLECNGGAPWQLSLVHAIEAASPLPAPSDPAVFVHHVLLTFRAIAYSRGEAAELYEPQSSAPPNGEARADSNPSQNAFQALREAARARKPRVLKLQIEGSKVDVEPDRQ